MFLGGIDWLLFAVAYYCFCCRASTGLATANTYTYINYPLWIYIGGAGEGGGFRKVCCNCEGKYWPSIRRL